MSAAHLPVPSRPKAALRNHLPCPRYQTDPLRLLHRRFLQRAPGQPYLPRILLRRFLQQNPAQLYLLRILPAGSQFQDSRYPYPQEHQRLLSLPEVPERLRKFQSLLPEIQSLILLPGRMRSHQREYMLQEPPYRRLHTALPCPETRYPALSRPHCSTPRQRPEADEDIPAQ